MCRVGRVFEAHDHKDDEQFGGPRRLGPPYGYIDSLRILNSKGLES